MIIASLAGGLGNQLFQYAMARRLAFKHGTELLLDVANYRRPTDAEKAAGLARKVHLFEFCIQARTASSAEVASLRDRYSTTSPLHRAVRLLRRASPSLLWRKSHVIEKQFRFDPAALSFPDNVYLAGFWQSEKYFADVTSLIRAEFELSDESITRSANAAIDELRKRYGKVISVHVRRGDLAYAFETLKEGHRVHGPPLKTEYYQRAMDQFDASSCFFIFSDSVQDVDWCRHNIKAPNVHFSDAKSELWDFVAMRSCDGHIIANSTFSWWAAWLDSNPDKRVMAPCKWSGREAMTEMVLDDLIPSDWILL